MLQSPDIDGPPPRWKDRSYASAQHGGATPMPTSRPRHIARPWRPQPARVYLFLALLTWGCSTNDTPRLPHSSPSNNRRESLPSSTQLPPTLPPPPVLGPALADRQLAITHSRVTFTDVTDTTGISFTHDDGATGKAYILEGMASGIVTFDYDEDGFIDIYFLNGAELSEHPAHKLSSNALYKNNGDFTFSDVTHDAGVGDVGFSLGGVAGDYNNDGAADIFVSNYTANRLFRNNQDGTFTDVAFAAGVTNPDKVGAGCSFFDYDCDGLLDLYAASYVDFRFTNYVPIEMSGMLFQAGPQYYASVSDTLYHNRGDGVFIDVSDTAGISVNQNAGMATLASDFNGDGLPDVFVCNDGQANHLLLNQGDGRFDESAVQAGVAFDSYGRANSSMGVDIADVNNDGRPDLFVTDYQSEMPVLYENVGGGMFRDATRRYRIPGELFAHVHWGVAFADFDNDGNRDIFIACGHFDPIEIIDDRTAKRVSNYLLMNNGNGQFIDRSKDCGPGLAVVESSRAVSAEDFDSDGDVDLIIINSAAPPTVLRNDTPSINNWVQFLLRSDPYGTDAVGAEVSVLTEHGAQTGRVVAGRGYQSGFGTRLHFGLGQETLLVAAEVTWNDGQREQYRGLHVNAQNILTRGHGVALPATQSEYRD